MVLKGREGGGVEYRYRYVESNEERRLWVNEKDRVTIRFIANPKPIFIISTILYRVRPKKRVSLRFWGFARLSHLGYRWGWGL
jgi:hypothetical protein